MSPPPDDVVTVAVLGERLNNALTLLQEVRDSVTDPITGTAATRTTLENHEARLKTLEGWGVWVMRCVVGLVIAAGFGVILAVGQASA